MNESHFSFIRNNTLRKNIDETFDHIITLIPFAESSTYNKEAKSAFCKTIIIHTASIIEAMLYYLLDQHYSDRDISKIAPYGN